MTRILVAILGVVGVAVIGIAGLAMLNLRALIGAHQDRLVARVEGVVGRAIAVGEVVPSWWPIGVRLRRVTVGEDADFGAAPFLVAEGVVMAVRLWPLVHGRIEAAGVVLDRPQLTLICDAEGRWNVASLGEATAARASATGASKTRERRRTPRVPLEWVVGVALSNIHDGTVVVDDRRGGEARRLVLRHVGLRAEDVHLGSTARVRVEAAVFASDVPDLHLDLRLADLGQRDLEHSSFTGELELVDVDLAALSTWSRHAGFAAGRVQRVAIDASGTPERWRGTGELRVGDSGLRIDGVPVGMLQPITLQARVEVERRMIVFDELRATLGTLALRATGDAAFDPWRVALAVTSESTGAAMLKVGRPPMYVSALAGQVTIDREGAALAPLRFAVDGAPVEVRGWITGTNPPALSVRVESRPFAGRLAADVVLEPTGAVRAGVEMADLDLAPAVARLAPAVGGRIEGRASGAAVLTARIVEGALAAGSLGGSGTLTIGDGRLREVNLPDLVVQQIESLPLMPQLVSAHTRTRYAELFASRDTLIESASVPFEIAHGRLSTEHAVFNSPAYQITGKGWIDVAEELRFHGTVLLGASVSRTLRDDVRAAKYLAADDGRITLPFVARGRLGQVGVEPDAKRLRSRGLAALLGESVGESEHAPDGAKRQERRRQAPAVDEAIERLERMLRP